MSMVAGFLIGVIIGCAALLGIAAAIIAGRSQ